VAVALERTLVAVKRALPELVALQLTKRGGQGVQRVVGKLHGSYIASTFQAWRRPHDGALVAHEAYARSHSKNGEDVSPWQLFADAEVDHQLVTLDRLCRTVHALNYFAGDDPGLSSLPGLPLVLNVDARLLQAVPDRHGEFFSRVLALLDVAPEQIVIDIRTAQTFDLTRLRRVIANYRQHGFQVAVNAEGVIHARSLANFLAPDFLMLEADVFSPAALATLTATLAQNDVRIALKRVETPAQLAAAKDAGVHWVKGFLLDRPESVTSVNPLSPSHTEPYTNRE
jgi:EAL domain-containing protein (putative c-di-GMP-specific phosphodiesterase class I)